MSYKNALQNKTIVTGLVLSIFSTIVFSIPEIFQYKTNDFWGLFFINYSLTAIYFIILFARWVSKHKWRLFRFDTREITPLLILGMFSAYALNRDMRVFHVSVDWLCIVLIIFGAAAFLHSLLGDENKNWNKVVAFLLGIGIPFFLYLSVYLAPIYLVSAVAFFFLGVSLHSFVPLVILIFSIIKSVKLVRQDRLNLWVLSTGLFVAISFTTIFAIQWSNKIDLAENAYSRTLIETTRLPSWVKVAQVLPSTKLGADIVKGNLVYNTFNHNRPTQMWGIPNSSLSEERKHNPLIMFASIFTPPIELSIKERVDILNSMFDSRHNSQERLWRGNNLITTNVITHIKTWPEYRMAYTDKILTVKNTSVRKSWLNSQEALYTFKLPEGSVISSLSLWIEGEERPGILTTKQKADSAYKTIVGRERRDPSLVHWQEGNTVTVRVFPVNSSEIRRFKIGITSPLKSLENDLVYENITFEGPSGDKADEIRVIKAVDGFQPIGFKTEFNVTGGEEYTGRYQDDWSFRVDKPELSNLKFNYSGKSYQVKEAEKATREVQIQSIYLDLNKEWSQTDVIDVMNVFKGKDIYVYLEKRIKLTEANVSSVWELSNEYNFSLFPFHEIENPNQSILITKGSAKSPTLKDLRKSKFFNGLKTSKKEQPYLVFNFSENQLSPYLKSLKELGATENKSGTLEDLSNIIESGKFPIYKKNSEILVIEHSEMAIHELNRTDSTTCSAPDHLFRLFAYGSIMNNCGVSSIETGFTDSTLVNLAELAYVVSPVSSLIVLETQKDYDRFDIKKSKNSLGNAKMSNSGAVPEPHEWALIILLGIGFIFLIQKRFF